MSGSDQERFEALARGLLKVPKDEADKQAKKYEREKQLRLARKRSVGKTTARDPA